MPLPRSGRDQGRGRGRGRGQGLGRDGRDSPANPQPTRRGGRGSSANAVPTRRTRSSLDDSLRPRRSSAVHYCARPSTVCTPSEEQQHVGSSASVQTPHPDGLRHLSLCKEQHTAEPAAALHKLDFLSLKDLRYPMAMEVSSTIAVSLPSQHHTIEASPPSGRSLSSSPIWNQCNIEWGITFYTIKVGKYFRTFPDVGRLCESKDEVNTAIDSYLTALKDPNLGMGLSGVEKLIHYYRHFPDGTKKSLKAGQQIDKKRDTTYQLVQAVMYKYNDHHNRFGDRAYEVKDVPYELSSWEEENYRTYIHMNFTAKAKASDGVDTGSDKMFFAEVTYVTGEDDKFTVNCCCMVKPSDNDKGHCLYCGTSVKHPNDGNAYTGGRMNASYSLPFGPSWGYNEDSDEEVERLRFLFGGPEATAGVPLEA